MLKVKNNKKEKYWLIDLSFIIYNQTYANKRACSCVKDSIPDKDCAICDGTGKTLYASSSGQVIGGLYGLFSQIIFRIDEGYNIELIIDPPKSQLERTALLCDYKSGRIKPPFIHEQMSLAVELALLTGKIKCYTADSNESDDVLAIRAKELSDAGHSVVVSTDDKDLFVVLSYPNVRMYKGKQLFGLPEFHAYVKKKWNIHIEDPGRFSDYLALSGDVADGFSGIPGIGAVAAEYFLNKHENIIDLWNDFDSIPEKYKKKLVSSCKGNICKKCKKCNKYNKDGDVVYLKDVLDMNIKLAYLNMNAEYYQLENNPNKDVFYNKCKELELYLALKNINKMF